MCSAMYVLPLGLFVLRAAFERFFFSIQHLIPAYLCPGSEGIVGLYRVNE